MSAARRALFVAVTFLSAFLLFQVELIMGKFLLPGFGGVAGVWVTCLFFFQGALLLGYWYTDATSRLARRLRFRLHVALLIVATLVLLLPAFSGHLPLTPEHVRRFVNESPTIAVVELLAICIGLPFVVLSATSPLLQEWYAAAAGASPYRLYAVSNFGSLLGLLSYPVLVEPRLRLSTQAWCWSAGFLLFVLGSVACGRAAQSAVLTPSETGHAASLPESRLTRALWILLPAVASSLLVSTTTFLTQDVAPVPLLWAVPLALYLITLILAFSGERIYRGFMVYALTAISLGIACRSIFKSGFMAVKWEIAIYSAVLFFGAWLCHAEAVRLKPAPERLTKFYLYFALGGALGSAFASVAAPHLFHDVYEFHISMIAVAWLALFLRWPSLPGWRTCAIVALIPIAITAVLVKHARFAREPIRLRERSFYGVLTVYERDAANPLNHAFELDDGRILHGLQLRSAGFRRMATTYYSDESGIGMALLYHPRRANDEPMRVGMVGLGTGTIAVYARPADEFRAYELNPQVPELSRGSAPYFSYVKDCRGIFDIVLGDARISMAREASRGELQDFDVLALDAFSGDSIPVHLLTREAFQLFLRHMRDERSILAVHITNSNLDLAPVVWRLAREFGLHGLRIEAPERGANVDATDWILLSRREVELPNAPPPAEDVEESTGGMAGPLWTDDFTNLWSIIK